MQPRAEGWEWPLALATFPVNPFLCSIIDKKTISLVDIDEKNTIFSALYERV
jgi:hypothetical protein